MAYSKDFVKKAVAYKDAGRTFKQLRETFGIPPETFYQWKERLKNGYYEAPKARKERSRKIDKEKLKRAVQENPGLYLYELAELFGCTPQAVFYMLKNLRITLKKRPLPITKNPKKNAPDIQKG